MGGSLPGKTPSRCGWPWVPYKLYWQQNSFNLNLSVFLTNWPFIKSHLLSVLCLHIGAHHWYQAILFNVYHFGLAVEALYCVKLAALELFPEFPSLSGSWLVSHRGRRDLEDTNEWIVLLLSEGPCRASDTVAAPACCRQSAGSSSWHGAAPAPAATPEAARSPSSVSLSLEPSVHTYPWQRAQASPAGQPQLEAWRWWGTEKGSSLSLWVPMCSCRSQFVPLLIQVQLSFLTTRLADLQQLQDQQQMWGSKHLCQLWGWHKTESL